MVPDFVIIVYLGERKIIAVGDLIKYDYVVDLIFCLVPLVLVCFRDVEFINKSEFAENAYRDVFADKTLVWLETPKLTPDEVVKYSIS